MMKMNGLHLLAIAVLATTLSGCGNKENKGFASVNGTPITNSELIEYLETKSTVRVSVQGVQQIPNSQEANAQVSGTLAFQALQDMVVRKLVIQMAQKEGVLPSMDDVNAHIKLLGDVNPTFVQNLQSRGLSMKGIREQVQVDLAQQNLVSKGITVTDAEVDSYIKSNKAEFQDPAKAEMLWIVSNTQSKALAEADLNKGTKFEDVAVKFSIDPNAKQLGGKFNSSGQTPPPGGFPINALAEVFRTAVEKTTAGKSTDWIAIPGKEGTFAKFYVVRKTEARDQEITPARKELVKRGLAVARGQQTKDIQEKLATMLREAKITVEDENLKPLWEKFSEKLKSQASDTSVPQTTPAN
ncbi:MAG: SurA N-terminal domain-containing protein [Fimbriimonadaceae bacterium]